MERIRAIFAASLMLLPVSAHAGEPVEPVKVLMGMAEHNAGTEPAANAVYEEYFSANMLLRFFSQDFTRTYAQALLRANAKRNELLLDWDPIIGGQDSCPLKNIGYSPATKKKNGKIEIVVSFKARACYEEADAKNEVTEVIFTIVKEVLSGNTYYLIDDIAHRNDVPLKATLAEMAK